MRHVTHLLIGTALFLAALPLDAATEDGFYASAMQVPCNSFVAEMTGTNEVRKAQLKAWVAGYITAYNRVVPGTYNILGTSDINGALSWLEYYCERNPLENTSSAMETLISKVLYSQRYRTRMEARY